MGTSDFPGAQGTASRVTTELDLALSSQGTRWSVPQVVWHIGDLSYAEGRVTIWDKWQGMIQPYASRVPYLVTVG